MARRRTTKGPATQQRQQRKRKVDISFLKLLPGSKEFHINQEVTNQNPARLEMLIRRSRSRRRETKLLPPREPVLSVRRNEPAIYAAVGCTGAEVTVLLQAVEVVQNIRRH